MNNLYNENMKVIVYILLVLLALIVLFLIWLNLSAYIINPKKEYEKDSPYYRFLLNFCTWNAFHLLHIKIHATGLEKVPQNQRFLLVGNHRSNFDPLTAWITLPKSQLAFVSKPENFKIPAFGRIIRKCAFMALDRSSPRSAVVTVNNAIRKLKNNAVSVGIYPEGTRSKECVLLPFHNGVFKIAQRADVPVVVAVIRGTEKIHKNVPFKRSDVYFDVIDVISAEEVKSKNTNDLGTYVYNKINDFLLEGSR